MHISKILGHVTFCYNHYNSQCVVIWQDSNTAGIQCNDSRACLQGRDITGGWGDCKDTKFYFSKNNNKCGWKSVSGLSGF